MNILLVYPKFPDTFWSFKYALQFIDKKATNPPLGLVTVAAMLPEEWHTQLVDMNVGCLRPSQIEWADMVFISGMEVHKSSALEVIRQCKHLGKKVVAGGPLFTMEYTAFPEVDHFILNEAEITLPRFLADFSQNKAQRIYQTEDYADIQTTPTPLWSLLDLKQYDAMSIQYSRGCPYNCEFCNVTALLGHRPRIKTTSQLITELDALYKAGWRRNIFLVDDNFIGNKKILKEEVLPAMIEWRKDKDGCQFLTEASINLADDAELLDLMARAGFHSVFVGIETPDEGSLEECHKSQNKNRDLLASIHRIQKAGMQVMGGFIVGFDNDTPAIFQRQIDFIQSSGIVTAMMGILQAPAGTKLYARMQKEGRLVTEFSGDNGDGTTNMIPRMPIEVLRQGFFQIIRELYSPRLFYQRVQTTLRIIPAAKIAAHLEANEIRAFFRSIWRLGILGEERWQYWRLLLWTLLNFPAKFPMAVTLAIYGYHFRAVASLREKSFEAQRALTKPLKKVSPAALRQTN